MFVVTLKNSKTLTCHTFLKKKLNLPIICSKCGSKVEESIEILKIIDLIINIEQYQNKYDWRK